MAFSARTTSSMAASNLGFDAAPYRVQLTLRLVPTQAIAEREPGQVGAPYTILLQPLQLLRFLRHHIPPEDFV
jgi:hypothetical protein